MSDAIPVYCRHCDEPLDVYQPFEDRFCSEDCHHAFHSELAIDHAINSVVDGSVELAKFAADADTREYLGQLENEAILNSCLTRLQLICSDLRSRRSAHLEAAE